MLKITVILGPTACGKSELALALARKTGGQIVSADSMQVYRRMDIGTAKPSPAIRREIPHHCIDLVEPSQSFSVAQFVARADSAIADIAAAGKCALVVGGTALYLKSLAEGLFEGPSADPEFRSQLADRIGREGLPALHAELAGIDPQAAGRIHPNDQKRIVRALEVYRLTGQPISQLQQQWDRPAKRYDCLYVGLRRSREDLSSRINARVKSMVSQGLRDEVAGLLAEPAGLSLQAAQALGYAEMIRHLRGELTLEEATEQIKINTRQFAKSQRTWFRRFAQVHWIDMEPDTPLSAALEQALAVMG